MELTRTHNQALALAGILQATHLVDTVAHTGQIDPAAFNSIILSLFAFDAETPEAVYGGRVNLRLGLSVLRDILTSERRAEHQAALRYAVGVLHLQKRLQSRPDLQEIVHNRLRHAEKKLEHFTRDVSDIAASLAGIYQDTISTFKYRVQVTGSLQQLQNPATADKVRALLLAAIRSAHLYRQLGGSRWQLLLNRGKLLSAVDSLITTTP